MGLLLHVQTVALRVQCHHKKHAKYFVQIGDRVCDSSWETLAVVGAPGLTLWGDGEKNRMGRHGSMNKGPEAQRRTLGEVYHLVLTDRKSVV